MTGAPLSVSTPGNDGGAVIHLDVRPHALEFGAVHETLRENSILHHGDARRGGEESRHLGLHVRGVAGIRGSSRFLRIWAFCPGDDGDRIPPLVEIPRGGRTSGANPSPTVMCSSHTRRRVTPSPIMAAATIKVPASMRSRDNGMVAATELFHSLNDDPARSRTLNIGAHLD